MTDTQIKATKPVPARSMCSYPEAIWLCGERWNEEDVDVAAGIACAISLMFGREFKSVQADLERGHV